MYRLVFFLPFFLAPLFPFYLPIFLTTRRPIASSFSFPSICQRPTGWEKPFPFFLLWSLMARGSAVWREKVLGPSFFFFPPFRSSVFSESELLLPAFFFFFFPPFVSSNDLTKKFHFFLLPPFPLFFFAIY